MDVDRIVKEFKPVSWIRTDKVGIQYLLEK